MESIKYQISKDEYEIIVEAYYTDTIENQFEEYSERVIEVDSFDIEVINDLGVEIRDKEIRNYYLNEISENDIIDQVLMKV